MIERPCEVIAEVVGSRENAVGGGAWLDREQPAQYFLLAILGNYVEEDAENVGLLAENFCVRIVGKHAAGGNPALRDEARTHVMDAGLVACSLIRVAKMLFKICRIDKG